MPATDPKTPQKKPRRPYGTGSVFKVGRFWYIQYYWNARDYQESSRSTGKAETEALLRKRLTDIHAGQFRGVRPERTTFDDLASDLIADYRLHKRRTLRDAEIRIRKHLRPFFGHMRAVEFTTTHFHSYIEARRVYGAADGTIAQELALLKRMFSLARRTTPAKVAEVPYIPIPRQDIPRKGFLEHEDYRRLRDALPDFLKGVFVMGYFTGMRRGEIVSLQWEQVDLLDRKIRLEGAQTKTGEARVIPLVEELYELLVMQRKRRDAECPDCPFVFFRRSRKIGDFRKTWDTTCREAGVEGLLFHDLRRTGVRNLVRAGVPERVAMAISGHKTRSVFDRYNIVSERDVVEAAAKLETYLAERQAASPLPETAPEDAHSGGENRPQ